MANALTTEKLPASTKILYGVAEFGIAMLTASLQFVLLFCQTEVLAVTPGLTGRALLVGILNWKVAYSERKVWKT
jgi:Na+/melibiose symporter-like transporter